MDVNCLVLRFIKTSTFRALPILVLIWSSKEKVGVRYKPRCLTPNTRLSGRPFRVYGKIRGTKAHKVAFIRILV